MDSTRTAHARRRTGPAGLGRLTRALVILAAVLVLARLALPALLVRAINNRLSSVPEYEGRVADVDLALIRGAYAIDGVELRKTGGSAGAPLFTARRIDFSVAWKELVRGRLLSEIHVDGAKVTLVREESEETGQTEVDRRWQEVVSDLFPISISRFEVEGADIQYVDQTREPHIDISLHDVHIRAEGLRNRREDPDPNELPADVSVNARTVGEGGLELKLRIAPLEMPPLFDLDLEVRGVALPALNSLLRAYANVDVSRGFLDLSLEVAAREGSFEGYVKPFFKQLDFENITDAERPILGRVWESLVNLMEEVLKNPERKQLGTRVPFSGTFESTQVGTWTAIANTVRYGLGEAFSEAVEGTIQPEDVETSDAASP